MICPIIQKGVPIPPRYHSARTVQRIICAMAVGDSVLVENREQTHFLNCARRNGAVVTSRKMDGGGVRIWLIKPATAPLKKGKRLTKPQPERKEG